VVVFLTSVDIDVRLTVPGIAEAKQRAKEICKKGIKNLEITIVNTEKNNSIAPLEAEAAAGFPPNKYSELVIGNNPAIKTFNDCIAFAAKLNTLVKIPNVTPDSASTAIYS